MNTTGKFRVYFNRHQAAPLVWCIAPEAGGWEIAVAHVVFRVDTNTVFAPKETKDEDDGKPSGWLYCEGALRISGSIAIIEPAP